MHTHALMGAKKGRFWPSFFFGWGLGLCSLPLAAATVYRCGQQYTNAPADALQCERVTASPSVVVIPGTRVQTAPAGGAARRADAPAPAAAAVSAASAASESVVGDGTQPQRDVMARSVLQAELTQAREREKQLQQRIENLSSKTDGSRDGPHTPHRQQDLVKNRAALERVQRDIQSLEREMARLPATVRQP